MGRAVATTLPVGGPTLYSSELPLILLLAFCMDETGLFHLIVLVCKQTLRCGTIDVEAGTHGSQGASQGYIPTVYLPLSR